MADFTPVGNTGTPIQGPNVLQSLSGILGLAQQKQSLGIQAQELQQQKLKTKAQTEYSDFLTNFDPSKYIGADGTLDANGVRTSPEYKDLSLGKPLVDQYVQQVQAGQLQNKQALQTLDNDTLNQMTRGIGAIAGDPDVVNDTPAGRQKVTDFYRTFAQQSPEAARISGLYGQVVRHAKQGDLGDAVYAQQLMGADVLGQRSQQQPQALSTGAGIVNRQPRTGAISAPPGASPGTPLNPTPTQVATATAAGTGQVGTDNSVFAKTMAAGANSERGVELAQKVEQEAGMVRTGQLSQEFANRLTVLQQHDPSITARQLLQKDAQNLKTLAEEGAASDAERNQIGGGFPSPETMDPDAVQKAARYWQGAFKMAGARRDNAISHVSQNGTAGLALKDAAFMANASPGKFAPPEPKQTGELKEGQTGMSKSGKPMIVRSGRWEYAQ